MVRVTIALLIGLLAFSSYADAKEATPLKAIAPDLVIESAEIGQFLNDPADPRDFRPTTVIGKDCRLFGWRMKVKTTRKAVLIQEKSGTGQIAALPVRLSPKYGYLFAPREIVMGVSPGKYSSTVFVENVRVKTFTWTVE